MILQEGYELKLILFRHIWNHSLEKHRRDKHQNNSIINIKRLPEFLQLQDIFETIRKNASRAQILGEIGPFTKNNPIGLAVKYNDKFVWGPENITNL